MNTNRKFNFFIVIIVFLFSLFACSAPPSATQLALLTDDPLQTEPVATSSPIPQTSTTISTPTPTSEPLPTSTPTSAPPPDLETITAAFEPVVSGQGVSEAAAYDPNQSGPHPVILILDSLYASYYYDAYTTGTTGWFSRSVQETELVIIGKLSEIAAETQDYCPQQKLANAYSGKCMGAVITITGYQARLDVEVRVAQTGALLDSYYFLGGLPGFPSEITDENTHVIGYPGRYWDFEETICPYVMPGQCWGAEVLTHGFPSGGQNSSAFSPDQKTLAAGLEDGDVDIKQIMQQMGTFRQLPGNSSPVRSVAFSPDGETLATGSEDGLVKIWHFSDETLLLTLEGASASINDLAYSPDGQTLASASADGNVSLWQPSDGSLIRVLEGGSNPLTNIAFSPDGQMLASGSTGSGVILWKIPDGTVFNTLEGFSAGVNSLAFSPDGQILAIGTGTLIEIRLVSDGSLIRILDQGYYRSNGLTFSPDGKLLASPSGYSQCGILFLWQLSDGRLLPAYNTEGFGEMDTVVFSQDGETMLSMSGGTFYLWNKRKMD